VGYYDALSRLPEVSAVAPVAGLQALPAGPDGRPESGASKLELRVWGCLDPAGILGTTRCIKAPPDDSSK